MSQTEPNSYVEWLTGLPIPWLTGPNGLNEFRSYGSVIDGEVTLLTEAVKARFPDYATTDALGEIGNDRLLIRGPVETDENYATRLKFAWDDWARAGTALELLVQLFWTGFEGAVIAQQNGTIYYLTGTPTAGEDPSGLLTIVEPTTINALTSATAPAQPLVPAGSPWWTIDQSTEFGSRFTVLFPGPSTWFMTWGTATFSSSSTATLAWNKPLEAGLSYSYIISNPTLPPSSGAGPVVLWLDPSTVTTTGATLTASDDIVGFATVVIFPTGSNPFASLSPTGLSVLERVIRTWRPARSTCTGVYALEHGLYFGWPVRTFGYGGTFSASAVVTINGDWI
jgi:hypothetical protein